MGGEPALYGLEKTERLIVATPDSAELLNLSTFYLVKAALTHERSSGQVEGQINRLMRFKRQLYRRANFDLLITRRLHQDICL